ncbi:MAG TPA: DUF362 domain-containing protein [Bacteroidales bacterium]|nr:DUF362 domain-containing protein [Bacteroidales bacterium]
MKKLFTQHLRFCPKSGKFIGFKNVQGASKLLLPVLGLIAMIWILIRVIPKPSRLSYPCVQSAIPLAAGFFGYISIAALSTVAFLRSKKSLRYYPLFFVGAFIVFAMNGFHFAPTIVLTSDAKVEANQPFGEAKGIFPGRVVWVHNPNAVNQNCISDELDHAWYMAENNNQGVINGMVSAAIDSLTGSTSDTAAWRKIFQFHNQSRGKGAVNYKAGEKIFIRINICSSWGGNYNPNDLSKVKNDWYGMSETSPAMVLAVLHQLVDVLHVVQSDIYIGDPMKHIYKHEYDQWHSKYPNVHYLDNSGYTILGRENVVPSTTAKIYYSDHGAILRSNVSYPGTTPGPAVYSDNLYTIFETAEYMINLPQLKGHKRAGVTMFAKNHFGSVTRSDAMHMHNGLPAPLEMQNDTSRLGYGKYRIQVDLMTHSLLRKKNLLFLMDALWATDHEQDKPLKWQMAPFNNQYTASVFASFDNVAIESVGYDFLRSEFTIARGQGTFAQMRGVDDYLHQAADSTKWPVGIKYDPDNSGVHIYSLGVHEHWNNAVEKKYSRNLGTGNGIELTAIMQTNATGIHDLQSFANDGFTILGNNPNPFSTSTTISYNLPEKATVEITIYDLQGKAIFLATPGVQSAGKQSFEWNGNVSKGNGLRNGIYIYRVRATATGSGIVYDKSAKMMVRR